ncbi:MAG: four helix bundle protein [Candidatus Delongbacteria bacterium]|jgi:four helix bundle protein|nr:four helix bundle protein [Candidatus Delongbacteria bacterium]
MKKSNIIKDKSFDFALRIIKLYKFLIEKKEFILSKQILRSGTSVGAMVRESEQAESKPDFIHKLAISLKEANETEYWMELLHKSDYIDTTQYESIKKDCKEILKLLTSIIKSSRGRD